MSLSLTSLAQQALLMLGVYDPGEIPSSSELNDLLLAANNMLDNYSLERVNIPVIVTVSANLTNGTPTVTFGPAGTFGTRYLRLDTANILVPSAAVSGTYTTEPCKIVSEKEFSMQSDKAAASQVPQILYYDFQFPTATANLWPTPFFTGTAIKLEVGGWQALANFPDLTTVVVTPQGLDRMLVQNFACEIFPQYPAAQMPPRLEQDAAEAKAAFRAMNASNFGQPDVPPPSSPLSAIPAQAAQ